MGKSLKNTVTPDEIYEQRRRHAAAVRDGMGPLDARGRGRRETSSACTASCSGCGATSSTRTPATAPARARPTRPAGCCTARSPASATTWSLAVQHGDRQADRAEQPPHQAGRLPAGGRRAAGADGRPAGAAPRRGAVGQLGHEHSLTYEPFPVADPAMLVADTVEYPVQVNGKVRSRHRGRRPRRRASRRPRWPTKGDRRARRRDAEEGHRRPRPDGQHRRLTAPASSRPSVGHVDPDDQQRGVVIGRAVIEAGGDQFVGDPLDVARTGAARRAPSRKRSRPTSIVSSRRSTRPSV